MASEHQITCIRKINRDNPHERITHVGGYNADGKRWIITQEDAIKGIQENRWRFYVGVGSQKVDVIIAERNHRKYLKTRNDGDEPNNLLSLSECR